MGKREDFPLSVHKVLVLCSRSLTFTKSLQTDRPLCCIWVKSHIHPLQHTSFRNPPAGVKFQAMAFRAMKDTILRDGEYHARAKRCGYTVSLDTEGRHSTIPDQKQDIERQAEDRALLERVANVATPKEAKIIRLLVDGFALHEAARFLKIPRAAAVNCMNDFCCRARAAIG